VERVGEVVEVEGARLEPPPASVSLGNAVRIYPGIQRFGYARIPTLNVGHKDLRIFSGDSFHFVSDGYGNRAMRENRPPEGRLLV